MLTRQTELRRLEVELNNWATQVAETQAAAIAARRTVEEKANLVEVARTSVQEAEISIATQRQEERAAQAAVAQIERQVDDATREMTRLHVQEQADHERHEQLREAMAAAAKALQEAEPHEQLQTQLDELATKEQAQTNS